jgi:hypothetical protein
MNFVLFIQTLTMSHYLAKHMRRNNEFEALPMPMRPKSKSMPRTMAILAKAMPRACLPQSQARTRSYAER